MDYINCLLNCLPPVRTRNLTAALRHLAPRFLARLYIHEPHILLHKVISSLWTKQSHFLRSIWITSSQFQQDQMSGGQLQLKLWPGKQARAFGSSCAFWCNQLPDFLSELT